MPHDVLECPVCMNAFGEDRASARVPKVFSCGHTLCGACIQKLPRMRPPCPMCRKEASSVAVNWDLMRVLGMLRKRADPDAHPGLILLRHQGTQTGPDSSGDAGSAVDEYTDECPEEWGAEDLGGSAAGIDADDSFPYLPSSPVYRGHEAVGSAAAAAACACAGCMLCGRYKCAWGAVGQ